MSRFATMPRLSFGRQATPGDTVPSPKLRRASGRRMAQLAEATDVLAVLPGPDETLEAIQTGRYDLAHLLVVLVDRVGTVDALRIATLSYNANNLSELLALSDSGKVKSITLLCSAFFRQHNRRLFDDTLSEFRQRGHRAAAARSHAKIITLALPGGDRWVLSGSANLRSNGNAEQFSLCRSRELHDYFAAWIEQLVSQHAGDACDD